MGNKLYLIEHDDCYYDEFDGGVVSARSEKEALEIAKTELYSSTKTETTIECIAKETHKETGVVLASFNAG